MGFLEVLTLIFIVLMCFGIISWEECPAVLPPLFIGLIFDVTLLIILFGK